MTPDEVADAVRRIKQSLAYLNNAEASCLNVAYNGPDEKDVARAWGQAGQAAAQADRANQIAGQAIQEAKEKGQDAKASLDYARRNTTLWNLLDARDDLRDFKKAAATARTSDDVAEQVTNTAKEAIGTARDVEHDLDLKESGGALVCAKRLREQRKPLEQLLQLASINPDAFKAKVAQAKADYLAWAKRQHEEFQAKVKPDLDALLQSELAISAKVDSQVPYSGIVGDVNTLKLQLKAFRQRYGGGLQNEPANSLVVKALQAGDAILATFDTWEREVRASADVASLQRQAANSGSSMVDRANAVQAAHGLGDAQRQQADAQAQRLAQWDTAKRFLDEARKIVQSQVQTGAAPPK